MRVSYSSLNTYKTCPLKYKYQNIDRIKTPKGIDALYGSTVHSALKFMFNRNPLYPSIDEVVDFFRSEWENKKNSLKADDLPGENVYYKDGIAILEKFYKNNPPWNFNVVDLESRFDFSVEDYKTGEKHTITGSMDRVDKNSDGSFEIIDYKTKRKIPSQKDVDGDLQMSIYHLALVEKWPQIDPSKIKLSLHFLKHNEKITTTRTKFNLDETKNFVTETIRTINDKIKDNNNFPPSPSPLCDWCEYKQICPMWKHMFKTQEEKEKINNQKELESAISEYFRIKEENDKNGDRLDELKLLVYSFMDDQKVERVFGAEGYLTRTIKEKNAYDLEKAKNILDSTGWWKDILEPSEKKLDKIIPSLPDELKEKIMALVEKKKTIMLTMKKKISADEDEEK